MHVRDINVALAWLPATCHMHMCLYLHLILHAIAVSLYNSAYVPSVCHLLQMSAVHLPHIVASVHLGADTQTANTFALIYYTCKVHCVKAICISGNTLKAAKMLHVASTISLNQSQAIKFIA